MARDTSNWSGQRILRNLKDCADVSSSAISALSYNGAAEVLTVTFNKGSTYEYFAVPRQRYQAFCAAGSKGRYFQSAIRNNYAYRRV
jgi:hypothetical protein